MEVIALAGGLGTRLKSVVQDIPKPMAPINDKPFLLYLLKWLSEYSVEKIIFSTGYKSKVIEDYFGKCYENIPLEYAIENEPLGTGGGIFHAMKYAIGDNVLIVNGDTYFPISLHTFEKLHKEGNSGISIALKEMKNFDRYGSVTINDTNTIVQFHEKKSQTVGYINGGIYFLKRDIIKSYDLPAKFSFETEILEKQVKKNDIKGFIFDDPFIDIGIPEDYSMAKNVLA